LKEHGVLSKATWRFGMWTWIHCFEERHLLLKVTEPKKKFVGDLLQNVWSLKWQRP
jgi:hypothetical protein